ncbi:hypothetical protein C8F01DRAFT_548977 [Mycena amicta]|nr:hypothetical protein C8F01DRAFT_548977 [Mycena amicta]
MFSCIYSASASAAGVPCSSSASSLTSLDMSLDMPGAWKPSYNGRRLKSSSATAWPSSSLSPSTPSVTIVLEVATATSIASESSISASAPSFPCVAAPELAPERNAATSSVTRFHVSSMSTIWNRDTSIPSHSVVDVSDAPAISKAGIYGGRRGPTSRATSFAPSATSRCESVITASATSSSAVPELVSGYENVTSSHLRSHIQSTAFVSVPPRPPHRLTCSDAVQDRDTHVAHAEATSNSLPPSIAKAGIYGGRRGPTSPSTSTQSSSTSSDAATGPTPLALAPRAVPREKHMRVPVPSIRRHRATSTKRVGRDMTFRGMIPRGRQSSGLRIIVLVRTGLLADQRAKKMLEERAEEKERIEKEEKEARERERAVMGGMLDMAREPEREERMEMMAWKVKEVKRRRKGMDMDAMPAKKTKNLQIQGWQEGSETDGVTV